MSVLLCKGSLSFGNWLVFSIDGISLFKERFCMPISCNAPWSFKFIDGSSRCSESSFVLLWDNSYHVMFVSLWQRKIFSFSKRKEPIKKKGGQLGGKLYIWLLRTTYTKSYACSRLNLFDLWHESGMHARKYKIKIRHRN